MSEHHDTDEYDVHPHISSVKQNTTVLMALFLLTGLTVAAYNVRLGDANLVVALVIAAMKATLVMTFFMHLKYDRAFNILFFVGSVVFMGLFFGYTANDTEYRGQVTAGMGNRVDARTGEFAGGTAAGLVAQGGEMLPLAEHEGEEGLEEAAEAEAAEAEAAQDEVTGPNVPADLEGAVEAATEAAESAETPAEQEAAAEAAVVDPQAGAGIAAERAAAVEATPEPPEAAQAAE